MNPIFRRHVGDYEDKSQGEFECGEMPEGGIIYDDKDTFEDLKNCGWEDSDRAGGLLRNRALSPLPLIMGGIKARKAYPWMEHMCFNLCSQKQQDLSKLCEFCIEICVMLRKVEQG